MTNEEKNGEISFEELLNENSIGAGRLEPGERVEARIVDIGSDWVFLDLGGKSEGALDKKELFDENGEFPFKIGDTIAAYFLSSRHGEMLFTTQITTGEAGRNYLDHAWSSKIPVEGLVEREIKGGFQVKIASGALAFCPYSQMGLRRIEDSSTYVGKRMSFMITEYGEGGRNVILSNRMIVEAEEREKKEALKEQLREGMRINGTVAAIQGFGAFIDIGGIQGLLPISEIGWGRIDDIHDVLSIGQELEVMILSLDWEQDRVALSLKATLPDPWEQIEKKYPEGSSHHQGVVARLTKFGAFVTLEAGVDGLIHISKLGGGKRLNHPGEVLEQGQSLGVTVEAVDVDKRRLSLRMIQEGGASESETPDSDDYHTYLQKTPASMGTLGDILKDKLARAGSKKKGKQ